MKTLLPFVAALACSAALPAAAQTLKPGLWELRHKANGNPEVDRAMADLQKQMAGMPPEQRRQMEAMMGRQGVQMSPAAGGGMAVRMCLTREMVERNELPANQGDCKTSQQQRSGNTLKMAFTCTRPPSSGETQVTFNGPEAYTSKTTVTTTTDGQSEKTTVEGSGRWLGADCGSVQPIQPRK
ncbi:MAG TPA: DUF3617 domain-containing protein [Ramlibacter sp.]|jgi:hypothetical protein|uniref:DUF3617 domain-containing protein n=1 Tax=Ramlibacter sp. TaxID=1917967 RepID=UPI002D3873F6|nr:DUF3617 domain-containing protein [Ramlibacter sp.]HZY16918.1 DUF3617 domain-containing protein [Ramlibacter sp.]